MRQNCEPYPSFTFYPTENRDNYSGGEEIHLAKESTRSIFFCQNGAILQHYASHFVFSYTACLLSLDSRSPSLIDSFSSLRLTSGPRSRIPNKEREGRKKKTEMKMYSFFSLPSTVSRWLLVLLLAMLLMPLPPAVDGFNLIDPFMSEQQDGMMMIGGGDDGPVGHRLKAVREEEEDTQIFG